MSEDGFLSRWSRRKAEVKSGRLPLAEPPPTPPAAVAAEAAVAVPPPAPPAEVGADPATPPAEPLPTLDDVAALAPGDEVSRFVAPGVDENVKRAALKKLFTDPHYNVMDGLDIYIDDYGRPDPIPTAMLRQLNQARFMGLFAAEEAAEAQAAADAAERGGAAPEADAARAADADPPTPLAEDADAPAPADAAVPQAPDENPDLQLQPDDAARRPGAATRAGAGGL